jgi:hypothetical protein
MSSSRRRPEPLRIFITLVRDEWIPTSAGRLLYRLRLRVREDMPRHMLTSRRIRPGGEQADVDPARPAASVVSVARKQHWQLAGSSRLFTSAVSRRSIQRWRTAVQDQQPVATRHRPATPDKEEAAVARRQNPARGPPMRARRGHEGKGANRTRSGEAVAAAAKAREGRPGGEAGEQHDRRQDRTGTEDGRKSGRKRGGGAGGSRVTGSASKPHIVPGPVERPQLRPADQAKSRAKARRWRKAGRRRGKAGRRRGKAGRRRGKAGRRRGKAGRRRGKAGRRRGKAEWRRGGEVGRRLDGGSAKG